MLLSLRHLTGLTLLLGTVGAFKSFNGLHTFRPGKNVNANLQCGQVSKQKRTDIQSPTAIPSRCVYTLEAYSSKVYQVKIEMAELRLQQPQQGLNEDGAECMDRFEVNGFSLCGNNDGQHLYIPFDGSKGSSINLSFILPNQDSVTRWRLVVTQLECANQAERRGLFQFPNGGRLPDLKNIFSPKNDDSTLLAPPGCTQYFTERTGTFQSFNYNNGAGPYMTNLNYAICFQRQANDSAVEFSFTDFMLPSEGANLGHDGDCHSLILTAGKRDDYLMIPGALVTGTTSGSIRPTYFCGTSTKGAKAVYGAPGPFVIRFNSDPYTSAMDVGFQIKYSIV